jgi:hypothetical protein
MDYPFGWNPKVSVRQKHTDPTLPIRNLHNAVIWLPFDGFFGGILGLTCINQLMGNFKQNRLIFCRGKACLASTGGEFASVCPLAICHAQFKQKRTQSPIFRLRKQKPAQRAVSNFSECFWIMS